MKTTPKQLAGVAATILTATQLHAVNLAVNGSFEDGGGASIPGWTVTTGNPGNHPPGIYSANAFAGANVTDGSQALDFGVFGYGSGNSISQTIATVVGQKYSLSFDWGSEYGWGTQSQLVVSTIGIPTDLSESARAAYPDVFGDVLWINHHFESSFTANATTTSLSFLQLTTGSPGPDYGGLALDNIRFEAVPEPQHYTLAAGIGLLGLAVWRRQRNHARASS